MILGVAVIVGIGRTVTVEVAEVAARGINIQHIHRVDRTGYKAGALDCAMDQVEVEFIAIFDADFVPEKEYRCLLDLAINIFCFDTLRLSPQEG